MASGIHTYFDFRPSPYGGANQFLAALRQELRRKKMYQENIDQAVIVIMNANPGNLRTSLETIKTLGTKHNPPKLLLRVDGPIGLIRGRGHLIDLTIAHMANYIVDGVIFQSQWSKAKNHRLYNFRPRHETVILNAADPTIFARRPIPAPTISGKTKLIATSWSYNRRKGFDIYEYLDKNLDLSRYSMTFVGRSPIQFKNIRQLEPQSPSGLAKILSQHHVYITASVHDPCSNALIEAISVGLPVVARRSGGHPELVGKGGELFDSDIDVRAAINEVSENFLHYQKRLPIFDMLATAEQYISFANSLKPKLGPIDSKRLYLAKTLEYLSRYLTW